MSDTGGKRILIADQLDPSGLELLQQAGADIHQLGKDERERLPEILADYDALVVRSATKVTADLLRAGKSLKVVGRAGIGVDNVDVKSATAAGVVKRRPDENWSVPSLFSRRLPLRSVVCRGSGLIP